MTSKRHLDEFIEREREAVRMMRESLAKSHKLVDSMDQTLQGMLAQFEQMEESMQPYFKGMQAVISGENQLSIIEGTLQQLYGWQKLVEEKGSLIKSGPNEGQVEAYCEVLRSIQEAKKELSSLELQHCRTLNDMLASLEREGAEKLSVMFRDLLQTCCEPVDLLVIKQTGVRPGLPEESVLKRLMLISGFFEDQEKLARVIVDVRGKYLAVSIQSLLSYPDSDQLLTYRRGSHPIIIGLQGLRDALCPLERQLCKLMLPGITELFERTLKPAATLIQGHLNIICKDRLASCDGEQHRFIECLYLFDILEEVYVTGQQSPDLYNGFKPCFLCLLDACKQWLERLKSVIIRQSFGIPENASIHEGTALAVNCLKRLAEYETIVEAVLNNMDDTRSSKSSASTTSFLNPDSVVSLSFYIKEIFQATEDNFTRASKLFMRSLKADVFLLNNYNYLEKTLESNAKLAALITVGLETRFKTQVKSVMDILLEAWSRLASILTDSKNTPKDAYKMFCADLMEQLNIAGQISIPDADLRSAVRGNMQRTVLPTLQAFFSQHPSLFVSGSSRGTRLDPDTVSLMMSKIFEG